MLFGMTVMELIGQIFGLIAVAISFVAYQMPTQKKILFMNLLVTVAILLNYAFIGATTGMILNVVCVIRNLIFMNRDKKIFSGYENAILTYEELREIVQDPTAYESWHTALSTVNAVYLIVDRENGRKYVGSAYGKGGLLGRWTHYVKSLHGDNKLMKELLCDYPDRYTHFQFSIWQLLPKAVTPDEVIQTETLWKKKLLTYEPLGMNAN